MFKKDQIVVLTLGILFLLSCTSPQEQAVDLDEINQGSGTYEEGRNEKPTTSNNGGSDSLGKYVLGLTKILGDSVRVSLSDRRYFPDRFEFKEREKYLLNLPSGDSVLFARWSFEDSLRSQSAFFNWLDFAGDQGEEVLPGGKIISRKKGLLFVQGGEELFYLEFGERLDWKSLLGAWDQERESRAYEFIAYQQKRRNALWKKRDESGDYIPLLKLNP
ncbi:MAG: hypothetical protein EP338_13495 [Bacteroidetes bacterium]|nr:MAG: hypothetical protein EP338_13495 [Bacteroidota bacterium]